ncbi:hypothetical protein GCM10007067_12540 [Lysobacter bugurensis]|uniref:Uncharacterized protein n=1 Tax=Cognatilysobacter bugurensis TaxID=543356 RepID=A0A918SYQ3_9GAMM|nr:hypothetical protein GCM10007067_12540 [Lysobacter bugurensis]
MRGKRVFEAWQDPEGDVTFASASAIAEQRSKKLLAASAALLYTVEANTWEEAMAVHHLRMGYEPYRPHGEPAPCPDCHALVYIAGSGECWRCRR